MNPRRLYRGRALAHIQRALKELRRLLLFGTTPSEPEVFRTAPDTTAVSTVIARLAQAETEVTVV